MKNNFIFTTMLTVSTLLASCGSHNGEATNKTSEKLRSIISDETTTTQTIYGKIQGYKDGNIYTFKGIPYAKAERFMPPQEPDKFEDIKICRIYGPKAPQTTTTLEWTGDKESDYAFGNNFVLEPMDEENCLVLNIWTQGLNDGKKRPVFVWFHGGGFSSGSGHDLPCYEGRALAAKGDIVVVTINHRLNVLGYLDLSGAGGKLAESTNLGQQDLVKSLEWVQKNIANFGGDPANVTIGGQSGGGGKVSAVMAMPSAKGLFKRAIVQSGSMFGLPTNENNKKVGLAFLKELGVNPSHPEKLNEFSYEELVAAGTRAIEQVRKTGNTGRLGYTPAIDGKYIVGPTFDPEAPEVSRDVPMIIGTNLHEFCFKNDIEITEEEAKKILTKRFGNEETAVQYIEAFKKVYPNQPAKEFLNTDINVRRSAVKQAISKSRQGTANVYLFLFTWKPRGNALGASHGMELPFMFNNIDLQREMTGGTEDAYKLADLISSAYISFIRTGDPNVKGLPIWEPFTETNGATMIFNNQSNMVYNHDKTILDFPMPGLFR